MIRRTLTAGLFALLLSAPLPAQDASTRQPPQMTPEQKAEMDAYMKAGMPGAQHKWLASLAGEYAVKMKHYPEPGAPAMEDSGTATRKMILDGRVMVENYQGTMMGSPFMGHGMTGYENATGRYWSTWMDSMSTGMMVSEGSCDADHACTFRGSWYDPVKKAKVNSRMTTRWTSPTTEVFEMYGPDRTGKEMKMMEITYTKR
jgi:hypothetical protein